MGGLIFFRGWTTALVLLQQELDETHASNSYAGNFHRFWIMGLSSRKRISFGFRGNWLRLSKDWKRVVQDLGLDGFSWIWTIKKVRSTMSWWLLAGCLNSTIQRCYMISPGHSLFDNASKSFDFWEKTFDKRTGL
jgi:hypothetical protein